MASRPEELRLKPFRRGDAVGAGLVTSASLYGPRWQRLYQGVYIERAAFAPDDHRMWCAAAQLLLPAGAAVGGRSAAYLWNVDLLARGEPVTVLVPRRKNRREQPGLRVVRGVLPRRDVESFAGLTVTTPARTAFDLGRAPDRVRAAIAVDAMLHRRVVTLPELHRTADAHPGWRGVMAFREILRIAEPGAASPMETRLRLCIVDGGLPRPVAQYRVRDAAGLFVGQVDLAYPELRTAIEYEGDHHRERATFRKDIVRFNRLRAAGWTALRFTADDVFARPRTVVEEVRRALAEATARQTS
jgi:very-short-patch-repair endonuclease